MSGVQLTPPVHYLALHKHLRELGKLPFTFPSGAERDAQTAELETWRKMVVEEEKRRVLMTAKALRGATSP